jgi:NAD(P)-dependent dehydrogenase (short-subunit alcohol dehydrogenase family)
MGGGPPGRGLFGIFDRQRRIRTTCDAATGKAGSVKDLDGKVAVVTGGGSGIGRGTALALAEAGMHVVVADLDEAAAIAVAGELGGRAIAVAADVADRQSVEALAERSFAEFGAVHVLHNNAGVGVFARLDETTDADWRWLLAVNLEGVVNGVQAFLPRMKAQEGEKHIVNTASMAGMIAGPILGAYNATKFAVVAISETLRYELGDSGFGISVLCPGGVRTNIGRNSMRQRPGGSGESRVRDIDTGSMRMIAPEEVGRMVRRAIEENELYIFTHPEMKPVVRARFDRILAAFDRAAERGGG